MDRLRKAVFLICLYAGFLIPFAGLSFATHAVFYEALT